MNPYTSYYVKQAQTGLGARYNHQQTGHGLGNFLASMFRSVFPYVRSGFKALKDEVLTGGLGVLSDAVRRVPMQESLTNRVRNMGHGLTERAVRKVSNMTGSSEQKGGRKRKRSQSAAKRKTRNIGAKKKGSKRRKTVNKKSQRAVKPKNKKKVTRRKPVKRLEDIFG